MYLGATSSPLLSSTQPGLSVHPRNELQKCRGQGRPSAGAYEVRLRYIGAAQAKPASAS